MARRKIRTSWKVTLPFELIAVMAHTHTGRYVDEAMELQRTSGIWRKANGSGTGRFVYRSPAGNSVVFTIKGIALPPGAE